LSTAIHPLWYIDRTINEIIYAGKMPLTPLMLTSDINNNDSSSFTRIAECGPGLDKISFSKKEYNKHRKRITNLSNAALINMKTVSFKIGPNYIHNIIDSI
jgi:hypothetical protein